mgnify:CR=1 FL=1
MASRKLKVVVTRKLPDPVETRMRELFDTELNVTDTPMTADELVDAMSRADVLVPTITDRIDIEANLDSRAEITLPTTGNMVDFADPTTYNNATSMTMYDAKGQDIAVTYYFQKSATDTWNVYVTANGTPLATDVNGNPAASTVITFPANGVVFERAAQGEIVECQRSKDNTEFTCLNRHSKPGIYRYGINVNAIAPGVVDGEHWDGVDALFAKHENLPRGEKKRLVGEAVPFGRMGRAEDLTGMAIFLASPEADYIVAQTFNVDGGNWMS